MLETNNRSNELKTYEQKVRKILELKPETRANDRLLIYTFYEDIGLVDSNTRFFDIMSTQIIKPSFETITRCRRKLQEKHPDLREPKSYQTRQDKQEEYIEYSRF